MALLPLFPRLLAPLLLLFIVLNSLIDATSAATTSSTKAKSKSHPRIDAACPDYALYAQTAHPPLSTGPLQLPSMRPAPACRTFTSEAADRVVAELTSRLRDPDLARLFENAFSSTLDTTVRYFDPRKNLAFVVTGDINAQWLRDTGGQFAHLLPLLPLDPELRALVRAVIHTEARYIARFPYCGAYQPPPESGLPPTVNSWAKGVLVSPPVDDQVVFECKYELDSLASFLKLSRAYWEHTRGDLVVVDVDKKNNNNNNNKQKKKKEGEKSIVDDKWRAAMRAVLTVLREQSQSSWDADWRFVSYYNWTGTAGVSLAPVVPNGGNGEPRRANGLVGASHRPSDDGVVFPYITPVNAMMSVELARVAEMLEAGGGGCDDKDASDEDLELAREARRFSKIIEEAVWKSSLSSGGGGGGDGNSDDQDASIFAYETNGYGGMYFMDDANVPSLLSLPYLGFLPRNDSTYVRTKKAMLSRMNPYYAEGKKFRGVGGPHVSATNPWPMSQISAVFGSDDDDEIRERLALVLESTTGLGLVHESVNIYDESDYTRPWFAWANSYFAEMVLDLAERKPGLILKTDEPYVIGKGVGGGVERCS